MPPRIERWRITPDYMQELADPVSEVFRSIEDEILVTIARQFRGQEKQTATFEWQVRKLAQIGRVTKSNARIIAKYIGDESGLTQIAVERILQKTIDAIEPDLAEGARLGLLNDAAQPVSASIETQLKSYTAQALDRQNLVNTSMLNSSLDAYRQVIFDTTSYERQLEAAQRELNKRTGEVVTGVSTHQQAVRKAIVNMSKKGLTGFTDRLGRSWTPEAYVNMDIRTTAHNAATEAVFRRCDDYNCSLIEISSHVGARPRCEPFQGKIFDRNNRSGFTKDANDKIIHYFPWSSTSYGEAAGLLGINCGHNAYPFIPGLSVQTFTPYSKARNDKAYEQSQVQRQLERNIRAAKREAACLYAAGDQEGAKKAQAKVRDRQAQMRAFIKETGRARRSDREQVYGFDKKS